MKNQQYQVCVACQVSVLRISGALNLTFFSTHSSKKEMKFINRFYLSFSRAIDHGAWTIFHWFLDIVDHLFRTEVGFLHPLIFHDFFGMAFYQFFSEAEHHDPMGDPEEFS
jgi:hypothetical protein